MAIKRTTQRQNLVRPSNIVPDSGGLAMAQASQNIANAITNITQTIDQSQLDTALLEAESQGINIGSVVDDDGKPKPLDLMTLNSAFKPDMYNKANEAKAKARFKKFAINAFGLNVQNHVADYASLTLDKHQGDFADGKTVVQSKLQSYSNEWKSKVAPEVWNEIQPSINQIVGKHTRKASALHLQNLRTKALVTANKELVNLAKDKSDFIVSETLNDSDVETNNDLAKREAKVFEIIKANTTSEADYQKALSLYNGNLQSLVVEKSVNAAFIAKMPQSEIERMIKDIAETNTDPNINSETIQSVGTNKINQLFGIKKQQEAEKYKESLEIFRDISLKIISGDLNTMPTVTDIDALEIEDEHKTSLKQILSGRSQNLTSQVNKINKNKNLLLLDSIENGTPYQSQLDTSVYMQRIKEGLVDVPELIKFRNIWSKRFFSEEADKMDTNFAPYFAELGSSSSYIHSPSYYLNNIPRLKELGVIGKALPNRPKPLMTVQQYVNKVSEYRKRYDVESENRITSISIKESHSKGGMVGNQNTIKELEKTKSVPYKVRLNNQNVDLNILSADPDVASASLVKAVRFTTDYNTLHPSLAEAFKQIGNVNDPEMFTKITMAYSMLSESFKINQKSDSKLGVVLEASGVNDYLISNSRINGLDLTNKLAVANPESKQRIISKYAANGETEFEVFEKTFKSFVDQDFITSLIMENTQVGVLFSMATGIQFGNYEKSGDMKKLINDFQSQNGMDNLKDVLISDPRMMTVMNDMFWAYASSGDVTPDNKGMNYAMGKVLQKLFNQIGITEDKDGTKRWTFHPPLKQFESTLPATQTEDGVSETIPVTLKHEDLYKYIHYSINGQPNLWNTNDGFLEGHNNMNYDIVPNENFGKTPSYSIYIKNEYGGRQLVNNNFRFDWATSPQNEAYKNAINTIEDNDFRKWVYGLPGMERQQVRAIYNRWNSNMDPNSIILELQTLYNKAQRILPLLKQKPLNLTQYDAAKKNAFLKSLGLDFSLWLEK